MPMRISDINPDAVMKLPPQQAFRTILIDLLLRLREGDVPSDAREGIEIAMHIAFRLGEREGMKVIQPIKEALNG